MNFKLIHCNINITNIEKSVAFYEEALGLHVAAIKKAEDDSFQLTYLEDDTHQFQLELTWLKEHPQPYDLGENESHIAFSCDHFQQAYAKHADMGCICYENKAMGIYFIEDSDGYWLEIVPA